MFTRACSRLWRPILLLLAVVATASAAAPGETWRSRAETATARGDFRAAVTAWRRAVDDAMEGTEERVRAELRLAEVYQQTGEMRRARETAREAMKEVAAPTPKLKAEGKTVLGIILAAARTQDDGGESEKLLREAVADAKRAGDRALQARTQNNLATVLAAQSGQEATAAKLFREAAQHASAAREGVLALECRANAALLAGRMLHLTEAAELAETVLAGSAREAASHRHAMAVLRAGAVLEIIDGREGSAEAKLRVRALSAYRRAQALGEELQDRFVEAQAFLAQGRLYERERRWPEALELTRRAVFEAQAAPAADTLFRAEWQVGRILRDRGDLGGAIAAMQRARAEVETIRHDLALHYGHPSSGTSFREVTGGLFFDLADLLLRQADHVSGEALPRLLTEARDAAEALKAAELEDYFQDECVNLLRQKTAKLEGLTADAAVVYVIPLADRTEILVTTGSRIERVKTQVTSRELEETANRLRRELENRSSNAFFTSAQQLDRWLIEPLQPLLARAHPSTLVFVPGGALRTIPMGVLHDGQRFLIERYAIATVPGLTLLEPTSIHHAGGGMMVSGLSEARQDFPALPYVPQEVERLQRLYGGTELLNHSFVLPRVQQEFASRPYQIVHIASHGHFDRDASKTFVLTFDEKMTLNDLERLLQPARLRDEPVELLTLSACQTAAGDDRAALGLAGVAVKAGARSALATLWHVNDEASARVITDFYAQLRNSLKLNKAQALQTAQRHLLADPRYEHPCYWAPYLMIGNWL